MKLVLKMDEIRLELVMKSKRVVLIAVRKYLSNTFYPDVVQVAKSLADRSDFNHSCTDEAGRLLRVLVGQVKEGKILEVGTGLGVGSSWILSSIAPGVRFISIDIDIKRVDSVKKHIRHPQAEFVNGDWKEISENGPFHFIFADAAIVKSVEGDKLIEILEIGGLLFMDDFTPEEHWPEEWRGIHDPVREFWLNHPCLSSTEIYLTSTTAAILATRVR